MCRERSAKITYLCKHTYMSYNYGYCIRTCKHLDKEHDSTVFKAPLSCPACRERVMIRQYETDPPPVLALKNIHPVHRPKISRVSNKPPVLPETPRFNWDDDPDWPLRTPVSVAPTTPSSTASTTRPDKGKGRADSATTAARTTTTPLRPANLPPSPERLALAYKQAEELRRWSSLAQSNNTRVKSQDGFVMVMVEDKRTGEAECGLGLELGSIAACRDAKNDPWRRAEFFIHIDTLPK